MRRMDESGLSEIVGALLLILIVAVAATSTAVFVQQQQKKTHANQELKQAREEENVKVARLVPIPEIGPGADQWTHLNFTVDNLHAASSRIVGLGVNGEPAQSVLLTRFNRTSGAWESSVTNLTEPLVLVPRERVHLMVDLAADFSPALPVLFTDGISVEVGTTLLNSFQADFLPPSAVALLSLRSGTAGDVAVLDGSVSDHPQSAARLVAWEWTLEDLTPGPTIQKKGRIVTGFPCDGTSYRITLKVTDNVGLFATDVIENFSCGP